LTGTPVSRAAAPVAALTPMLLSVTPVAMQFTAEAI
jgi:hypothetical protein